MKHLLLSVGLLTTFALGYASRAVVGAAQPAAQPQVIDVSQITGASLQQVAPGVRLKQVASTPSGDVDVVEITNVAAHQHNKTDELIYVLSGTATATMSGKTYTVGPGQLIVLPHGIPHSVKSSGTVRVLGVAYPRDDPSDMQMIK